MADISETLRRAIEKTQPDLRTYYRMVRKARVIASYASDGRYWADVQPLRNDESEDPNEPVVPRVEIPILWAGPNRGVVCPPEVGTYCDLSYYDGDPNYPRISNFRWHAMTAPSAEVGDFVIQQDPDTFIRIAKDSTITIQQGPDVCVKLDSGKVAMVRAPLIQLLGNVVSRGHESGGAQVVEYSDRQHVGSYTLTGDLMVNGNITASGSIIDGSGNTNHHSH